MSENLRRQFELLPQLLAEHLSLTVIALTVGTTLCLPVAVLIAKWKPARWPTLTAAGVIQTIPSLALLALMVPLLYMVPGVSAFGFWPAIIALTLYSILPILRNTVTGIIGVDPAMTEAARGLGMTPAQTLVRVELPLALPVIIAGLRTATVWVVGIATLSTPIAQKSLGDYIFGGLRMQNWTAVLFGCIAAATLAIVLDTLIAQLEAGAARRSRRHIALAASALVIVFAGGMLAPHLVQRADAQNIATTNGADIDDESGAGGGRAARTIRVGGKTFVEQYILARLLQHQLQQVGYDVEVVQNLGSSIIFSALAQGEIDLYVEYTGTVWVNHMHRQDIAPAWQVERIVAGWLAEEHGVRLAATLGFENAYALAMRRDHAEQLGIRSIADLAGHAGDFTIASDLEFFSRPEWHRLLETYDLNFGQTMSFDATFMYQALAQGEVEVITAFSSDGRIAAYDLVVLDDPQQAFPPYDAVVLLGPSAADDPKLVAAIEALQGQIPVERMRRANQLVDLDNQTPSAAAQWLAEQIAR